MMGGGILAQHMGKILGRGNNMWEDGENTYRNKVKFIH